jgi:hypothetical protein
VYYTWLDVEWKLQSDRENWPKCWVSIEIYSGELLIYHTQDTKDSEAPSRYLEDVFGSCWDSLKRTISFQITGGQLQVSFQASENSDKQQPVPLPLFKKSFLGEINPPDLPLKPFPVPVIAFHSYKSGVGRTLSLFSLVWKSSIKTLIVDANIEAPSTL